MEEDNCGAEININKTHATYVNRKTQVKTEAVKGLKVRYNPGTPLVDPVMIGSETLIVPDPDKEYTIREVRGPFIMLEEIVHGSNPDTMLEPGYIFYHFYPA